MVINVGRKLTGYVVMWPIVCVAFVIFVKLTLVWLMEPRVDSDVDIYLSVCDSCPCRKSFTDAMTSLSLANSVTQMFLQQWEQTEVRGC